MKYNSKRWLYLVLCIVMNACAGILYAWSVFQKPFAAQINASAADISLSFTFMLALGSLVPIVVGKALDYVQPRHVLMLGGILFGCGLAGLSCVNSLASLYIFSTITGLGLSMVYPAGTVSNIVRFFPDRRGLAAGLLTAGASLGAIIWAPLAVVLIEQNGLSSTFRWIGLTVLVIIVFCGAAVQTAPKDFRLKEADTVPSVPQEENTIESNWLEMLRSPLFYLVAGVFLVGAVSGMMLIGYVSPIAQDILKISPQVAAVIVVLLAIANTTGRLCWGWVSDKIGRFAVIYILLALAAAAMVGLSLINGFYPFICLVMIIGLCYGGFLALMAPCTADLFGSKNLSINFGIMFLTVGLASLIGPRVAALVKEAANDYSWAFMIAALLNIIGMVFATGAILFRKKKYKPKDI